jgi:hypothetical protein
MNNPRPSRRSRPPVLDALGKLCVEGKQAADYLWQVPDDASVRAKIDQILTQIIDASTKQGRREMPKVAADLKTALRASPSPQQVDLLVNGFDRLFHLWEAAKSGLL